MAEKDLRCIGCGKTLKKGKTFRILEGSTVQGDFVEQREYGDIHASCFHRAVSTPRSAMQELRDIMGS